MEEEVTADTTAISAKVASCNVRMDGITFTGALNGADTCVTVKDGRAIEFRCTEKLDFFCDPNGGQLSNTILPILLTEVDNTHAHGQSDAGIHHGGDVQRGRSFRVCQRHVVAEVRF